MPPEENTPPTSQSTIADFINGGNDNPDTPPVDTPVDTPVTPESPVVPDNSDPDTPPVPDSGDDDFGSPFDTPPADSNNDNPDSENLFDEAEFDKQTEANIQDMGNDPHPGIKYKALRGELKEARQLIKQLESQVTVPDDYEELKARAASVDEVNEQLKEFKNKAALHDYTQTDEYNQNVRQPFSEIQSIAKSIDEASGLESGTVLKAIGAKTQAEQDAALAALKDKLSDRSLTRANNLADQMLMLYGREQQIASNAQEKLAAYQEKQTSQQAVETEQQRNQFSSDVTDIFSKFESKIPFLITGGQKSGVYERTLEKAKSLNFNDMKGEQKAFAAMSATLLPDVVKQLVQAQAKVKELQDLNSQYRGASPGTGSREPEGSSGGGRVTAQSVLDNFING